MKNYKKYVHESDAAYFSTYELLRRNLTPKESSNYSTMSAALAIVLSGGIAGIANWTVCIPFDTLKTRIQKESCGSRGGWRETLMGVLKEGQGQGRGGFLGLYAGLGPVVLRAFPASAAFFG
jgi:solute carrier family 25 (mitochondrial carnitine/acylcarnitine transporter), member 20/29